eukprot:2604744-Prymnesium_polylepis.1
MNLTALSLYSTSSGWSDGLRGKHDAAFAATAIPTPAEQPAASLRAPRDHMAARRASVGGCRGQMAQNARARVQPRLAVLELGVAFGRWPMMSPVAVSGHYARPA